MTPPPARPELADDRWKPYDSSVEWGDPDYEFTVCEHHMQTERDWDKPGFVTIDLCCYCRMDARTIGYMKRTSIFRKKRRLSGYVNSN